MRRSDVDVVWEPNPGPQTQFIASRANEVLYGGAAGGGKSNGLLGSVLRWCENPNYRGLYLRREATYLGDAIDKSRRIYESTGARLVLAPRITWTFPSGAQLWMNHCELERHVRNYDSFEFAQILFDELTHFTQKQYVGIRARLRGTDPSLPYHSRAATNPGGEGHDWVFARWGAWLDPAHGRPAAPNERRWYRGDDDVPHGTDLALSRTFIPARLEDNPHITPEYRAMLLQLDPVRRGQLERGDWLVRPAAGAYFKRAWIRPEHWLDAPPAKAARRVRYWDLAAGGDYAVGTKYSRAAPLWCVEDVVRVKGPPGEVRATVFATMAADGRGVETWIEQDPGQSGKDQGFSYTSDPAAQGYVLRFRPKRVDKVTAYGPFSAQAFAGLVAVVRGAWNDAWLAEQESFPDGEHDDQCDSVSGAHAVLTDRSVENFKRAWGRVGSELRGPQ